MKLEIKSNTITSAFKSMVAKLDGRMPGLILECVSEFVNTASKYTPPNIGRVKIEKTLFKRPVIKLRSGAYKVVIKRPGKKRVVKISRDENKLSKYLPIHYRGFSRAGWLMSLRKLNLSAKHKFNVAPGAESKAYDVSIVKKFSKVDYEIENAVPYIQKAAWISVKQGLRAAKRLFEKKKKEILK